MKKTIYWVFALLLTNLNLFGQDIAYQEVEPLFEAIGVKADKATIKADLLHKYDQQKIFIEEQRASFDKLLESEASFENLHSSYLDYLAETFSKEEITELSNFFSGDLGQSILDFGTEADFFSIGNQWKASQNLKDQLTLNYVEELEIYFNEGVGQKFIQNFENLYKKGETTFVKWEKVIIKEAFDNVKYQWRDEFETDYDLDVNLREGKFEMLVWKNMKGKRIGEPKVSLKYIIERKGDIQTNNFIGFTHKFKMIWLSNTRYRLYFFDKNNETQEDNFTEFNIYAVENGIIKYTWAALDTYHQAEMKRID
ncbi:MAG: hypothetical protein ACPG19_05550 [Saprospiraceae bacterium]